MIYDDCGCPPDGDSVFCSGPEYVECTTCWKKWIEKSGWQVDEAMRIAKAAKHVRMSEFGVRLCKKGALEKSMKES